MMDAQKNLIFLQNSSTMADYQPQVLY